MNLEQLKIQVLEYFSDLKFDPELHKYAVEGKPLKYSVSGIIKKYSNPFDADKIAPYSAKKAGVSVQEIKAQWKSANRLSLEIGNSAHDFGELHALDRSIVPMDGYQEAIANFWASLPEELEVVFVELRMYHKGVWYAGTMDILLYNKISGNFIIADYKGLPLDTPILTTTGWKNMGELTIKDYVFDKEGLPTKIKAVSEIHDKKCLKMLFDNSESLTSDFEHRWLVSFNNSGVWKDKVMTTQEIQDYLKDLKNTYGNCIPSYKIPKIRNPKPLKLDKCALPIDPYLLGVWLGDGHSIDSKITQANIKVWEEIENRGYQIGKDVSQGGTGVASTRTIFNIRKKLKQLNLLSNKHIPKSYLLSSYNQRLDLLRGFMDADGYYNKTRKRFVLATTRESQVKMSVELLASFGIKTTVIPCKKYCNNKIFRGWDVCFTTTLFNPFLSRNENIKIKTNFENEYRRIISVEDTEKVLTRCIEVDSPSHTFLAGKSMIVTHNTNKDLFKNHKGQMLRGKFSDLLDNPFNKYQIQLNYYQELIEQIPGINVSQRKVIWVKPDGTFEVLDCENFQDRIKERQTKIKRRWHYDK